jgi:hypothetical protein
MMMVCVVCARLWREPATYRLLRVHIYIGIHSTFFGRISMRTDRERCWCCVGGVVAAVRENFDINFSY